MPHGQLLLHHLPLYGCWQVQQPDQIGYMATRFTDDPAQRFLAVMEVGDQLAVCLRLFNRIEILALDIFHKRDFQRLCFVKITNNCWNTM